MNGLVVLPICLLVSLALRLLFFWGVYCRGGPEDLIKAAWAIRIAIRKNMPASGSVEGPRVHPVIPSPREADQPVPPIAAGDLLAGGAGSSGLTGQGFDAAGQARVPNGRPDED